MKHAALLECRNLSVTGQTSIFNTIYTSYFCSLPKQSLWSKTSSPVNLGHPMSPLSLNKYHCQSTTWESIVVDQVKPANHILEELQPLKTIYSVVVTDVFMYVAPLASYLYCRLLVSIMLSRQKEGVITTTAVCREAVLFPTHAYYHTLVFSKFSFFVLSRNTGSSFPSKHLATSQLP